jgi:NADPH2:quinone reductase
VERVVDVEFGANLPAYVKALSSDAVVATYASMKVREPVLPFYDLMRLNFTLRFVFVYTLLKSAKDHALADIARWLSAGRPRFAIAARIPLSEIVAAHELVESGNKIGHVILDIP